MSEHTFRAPAVPLIAHDPMFSLWSFADRLTDDVTRHWDGARQYMFGLVAFDGRLFEFMGSMYPDNRYYSGGNEKLPQTGCVIRPMTTVYTFENELLTLELTFTSPLLLNDLMILARPVSYVSYKITPKDDAKHEVHVQFGFSGEFVVNETTQEVAVDLTSYSINFSSGTEHMLKRYGDDHRIEWGTFHVVAPDHLQRVGSLRVLQREISDEYASRLQPVNRLTQQGPRRECSGPKEYQVNARTPVHPYYPTIMIRKNYVAEGAPVCDMFALAYDDVKCLQYFGEEVDAYWKKDGDSFTQMLRKAMNEYEDVLAKVKAFEDDLLAKANAVSPRYADIVSLAYRQAISAHKLAYHKGEILFISKENYSNGCAATVDVTYPSTPLFLMYQPDLVEGMLNPIFKLLDEGLWDFDFAPHDAGVYPLVNGQIYGYSMYHRARRHPLDSQMPVEECGNMLLCVAALCAARKEYGYFLKHQQPLKQWADYLVKTGHDPENQLCTDDFAGHLAHNVNLSAKAICALAAYARMLGETGHADEAAYYGGVAHDYAAQWEKNAFDGDHYRLTFDQPGTWSLKYNMVWDKLLNLGLFSQEVYDRELACYKTKLAPYGIPLDSRGDYTKTDWELWSTRLFDDAEYTNAVVDAMWRYLTETPDRTPFTDLHFVSKPWQREFQARSVQGGLFINLLTL